MLIAEHPNDLVRDQYVMKLAGRLEIDPDRVRDAVGQVRSRPHVRPATATDAAPPRRADAVDRRELDALRWAVQAPELMSGRLDVASVRRSARARVRSPGSPNCRGTNASNARRPRLPPCCSGSRSRISTTADRSEELATRVVVNLVEASSQRLLTSMLRRDDPRTSEIKALLDALANARASEHWDAAEAVAEQLVTWITDDADAGA